MMIAWLQEHLLYWNGGIRYIYEVTRRLAKENHVDILATDFSDGSFIRFNGSNIGICSWNTASPKELKYWLLYPYYLIKNSKVIKDSKNDYDVFISSSPTTHIWCLIARIKPILVVFELNPWLYSKSYQSGLSPLKRTIVKFWSPIAKFTEKLAYRNAVKIIAYSKFVQSEIKRVYNVDSEVVYTGIDTEFFKRTKNKELTEKYKGKRIILHVASYLSPMKGTEYAIEAMSYINKEFPDALLLIITSSNDWQRQEQLFGLAQLNHANIEFVRNVKDEDMPVYYSLAEVLLSPSLDENIHLPVLESQSCGCPVICFNKLTTDSEEIIHAQTGYRAIMGDEIGMASWSIRVLRHGKRLKLGKWCRQFVLDNFSWDKCVDNYKRIISEVVSA